MKVLIAPDKFKGSLTALEVATHLASGLLPEGLLQPLASTSYGFGQAVKAALALHPRTVVLALGGSASTDAGMGMLTALGAVFTNDQGRPLMGCGEELSSVVAADLTHLDGLLLGGRIVSGASYFLDLLHFDDLVTDADLVITGEGRIDDQTLQGKLPFVVAQRSTPRPVHVVVGRNDLTKGVEAHFAHIHQLSDHTSADSRSDPRLSTSILTEIGRAIATTLASQPVAR